MAGSLKIFFFINKFFEFTNTLFFVWFTQFASAKAVFFWLFHFFSHCNKRYIQKKTNSSDYRILNGQNHNFPKKLPNSFKKPHLNLFTNTRDKKSRYVNAIYLKRIPWLADIFFVHSPPDLVASKQINKKNLNKRKKKSFFVCLDSIGI